MNFKLFKNRSFFLYTVGNTISICGNTFLTTCMALYVLKITGSAAKFASVLALGVIPQLVLGSIAGSIVDRFNKKNMLVILDTIRGLFFMSLFFISLKSPLTESYIYIMVLVEGLCQCFNTPVASAVLPSILEKDEYVDGNLLTKMIVEVSSIIAPTIAVLMYSVSGIQFIILIDSITFIFAASCKAFMTIKPCESKSKNTLIFHDIIDGFKLYKDKEILSISMNGFLTHFLVLPFATIGLPYLIKNIFACDDIYYGVIQTISTSAVLFTVFTVPWVKKRYSELNALNVGMYGMLFSLSIMLLLSISGVYKIMKTNSIVTVVFFAFVMFIFNLSFGTYGIFFSSFNQRKIEKQYLGRFYSMLVTFYAVGRLVGLKVYGFLFSTNVLIYATSLAIIGMILKILLNKVLAPNQNTTNTKNVNI